MADITFFLQKETSSDGSRELYTLIMKETEAGFIIVGKDESLELLAQTHAKLNGSYPLNKNSRLLSTDKPVSKFDAFHQRRTVDQNILEEYRIMYNLAKDKYDALNQQI